MDTLTMSYFWRKSVLLKMVQQRIVLQPPTTQLEIQSSLFSKAMLPGEPIFKYSTSTTYTNQTRIQTMGKKDSAVALLHSELSWKP